MDTNNDTGNKYLLPIAVIVGGLFIAGAVMWSGSNPAGTGSTGSPQAGQAPKVDIKNVKTDGAPFIGRANAPVTIAVWSDFQCPFCKRWETETLPLIMQNYVTAGKVKIVFLDFAFLGPDSTTAAEYSRAIWKLYPDKYAEWRAAMYVAQDEEHSGFGTAASIDKLNTTIAGIDAARVAADVKANASAYRALMDADRAEAAKDGIGATPSFVIGTEVIQGAYPYANFQSAIDELLK